MHWTMLDGSPRGRHSNTSMILECLGKGLERAGQSVQIRHLALSSDRQGAAQGFASAQRFILGFPLYADSMPGLVMEFIEQLEPYVGRAGNPPVGFVVQSGFPEPGHSRPTEAYLRLLAKRLGSPCLGTLVKGAMEGVREMPPVVTSRLFRRLEEIGYVLGEKGEFDPKQLRALCGPDWFRGWRVPLLHLALRGIVNPHWHLRQIRNWAYFRREDRPYEVAAEWGHRR